MKRRFCSRPYEHVHLDPNGNVRICSWMDVGIGNLLEADLNTVWTGEKAGEIRKSIEDDSFRYCRAMSCPYLENASLPELEEEEFEAAAVMSPVPVSFNVACDFTCNHSCPSCRDRMFVGDETYKHNLDTILSKIEPYMGKIKNISACGNGDVFASQRMLQFLERLTPEDPACKISIETNGALFDEAHWNRIRHLGNYDFSVAVTPNSFEKTTFKYLNGGHDTYEKVMGNLKFIRSLKEQGYVKKFEISMVLQDRNFWELPDFVEKCIRLYDADMITVKPLYHWFGLSEEMFWFKDVLNPQHPYHKEYLEMMKSPVLDDPRVFFWGGKNLHPSAAHPAYRYKEYLEIVNRISVMDDFQERTKLYFEKKGVSELYLYGDMELTSFVCERLKGTALVRGIVARDICNQKICGNNVIRLKDFDMNEPAWVMVLNYKYFDLVQRDFRFNSFAGTLISLKDFLGELGQETFAGGDDEMTVLHEEKGKA